ncbi:hypothetical protein APICC_00538 [Apis cerana cerana]|uniref:Uncharacterized protein n=1 Tax=Apis cerana cerana TaxID=94128 RepID=A0A2A3EAQ4_APICC|nr:hypothetical protein APICC_00538 [Apis cerana cerana]
MLYSVPNWETYSMILDLREYLKLNSFFDLSICARKIKFKLIKNHGDLTRNCVANYHELILFNQSEITQPHFPSTEIQFKRFPVSGLKGIMD